MLRTWKNRWNNRRTHAARANVNIPRLPGNIRYVYHTGHGTGAGMCTTRGDQQMQALADQLRAAIMLKYNKQAQAWLMCVA